MFEEIGHFVEKIRRVGYGPLVLDQEPGNLRELQPEEVAALRQAAEGKLRTPKSKDLRRRNLLDAGLLPTVLPKPSSRPASSFASGAANKLFRPVRPAGSFDRRAGKPFRPARPGAEGFRPAAGRSFDRPPARPAPRPAWKKDDRPNRPPARFAAGSTGENRPGANRSFPAKPAWKRPERLERSARPDYKRPYTPRTEGASGYRPAKAKPYPNSASRAERKAGPGWKPKPSFNGPGKPATGSRSRPSMDRSSSVGWKPGYKDKSGSSKRTGPRPIGNRPGGKKRR